ncbi:MAG: hypothetical protein HY954_08730 [Deltaproteobacteria bacterium]|nr:hypothetical protein [Deltaproteobacteria bacterium]
MIFKIEMNLPGRVSQGGLKGFVAFLFIPMAVLFYPADSTAFLDQDTIQCLSYHDAAIATDVTLQVCSLPNCDHPLGVDYVMAATTNKGLRQPVNLDPAITLVNNNIGCTTCHVPYSAADHTILTAMRRTVYPASPDPMLVMDNRRSELCLGCHIK